MLTDLNSEFTHFNLVIRLSKAKQSAFRLCTVFGDSRCSGCPWDPLRNAFLTEWSRSELPETSFFTTAARAFEVQHDMWDNRQQACPFSCRCGLFGIWWGETCCAPNSLELESRFMPIGARLDHGPGAGNNRTTSRKLGTESCFKFFVVSSTNPHWSPISCVLPSPGRLAPSRAEVFVGFRCVRLVQALSSSPPPLVLFRVRQPSAFLFPCLSRVCPLRARCVVLVFSPSSFAFPCFASWLSKFSSHLQGHLTFTSPSSSSSPHLPSHYPAKGRVCVCVWHICTDVKLLLIYIY